MISYLRRSRSWSRRLHSAVAKLLTLIVNPTMLKNDRRRRRHKRRWQPFLA